MQTTEYILVEMTYNLQNGGSLAVVTKYIIWISVWNSQSPAPNKSVWFSIFFQITFDEVTQKEINNIFSCKYVPLLLQWELWDEVSLKDNLNMVFLVYFPINYALEKDFLAKARTE